MASWGDVEKAAPELAASVRARFEATGLGFLATLRKDGFPRISGIEPSFAVGEMWLGMMHGSLKAKDLQRDARMAVHAASVDKNVADGDARVTGRAVEVAQDDANWDDYVAHLRDHSEFDPDAGIDFHAFRIDVSELMLLKPGGSDHLLIESWREGEAPKSVKRY